MHEIKGEWLTPKEVAILLKCSVRTVYNWTKQGVLRRYGISSRVYYKRSEVLEALTPID